ncbi:MAG: RHS repeat-associated core domain-containing protein [Candidatus Binatia bacterium]
MIPKIQSDYRVVCTERHQAALGFGNVYLFAGRRLDGKTGLYYYRNRNHDPRSGRFISHDPLRYADGPNVYAYAQNKPVNLIDPLGLDFVHLGWMWSGAETKKGPRLVITTSFSGADAIQRRASTTSRLSVWMSEPG